MVFQICGCPTLIWEWSEESSLSPNSNFLHVSSCTIAPYRWYKSITSFSHFFSINSKEWHTIPKMNANFQMQKKKWKRKKNISNFSDKNLSFLFLCIFFYDQQAHIVHGHSKIVINYLYHLYPKESKLMSDIKSLLTNVTEIIMNESARLISLWRHFFCMADSN